MTTKHTELAAPTQVIRIRGARQNNLKNVNLDLKAGEFTVITGLSGSGKSSLVFDTLYAEGQRRYVETFSPYARQFLERMDRPQVDAIEGVPPAIAIDQTGAVRTSRSTVGTMTEINDHLKLLFANAAHAFCPTCGEEVRQYTPQSITASLLEMAAQLDPATRLYVTFSIAVPATLPLDTAIEGLSAQGYTRILAQEKNDQGHVLTVVLDRFKAGNIDSTRLTDAVEHGLEKGAGRIELYSEESAQDTPRLLASFREGFLCAHCDVMYSSPSPSLFSFNSPLGACPTCRGFGRVISVDPALVIPDPSLSLEEGAVKPWTTASYDEVRSDLKRYAAKRGVSMNTPYEDLPQKDKDWIWNGDENWSGKWQTQWYGVKHFFEWLESRSYKMHVRVLLSRYRSYTLCPDCGGSHLKQSALMWRYGTAQARAHIRELGKRLPSFKPLNATMSDERYDALPGFNYHELSTLPIDVLVQFFEQMRPSAPKEEVLVLDEIIARLSYLCDVGLGYLDLDRQSRTLSGGEVQRVNLTTALGTSLVNTLFVLDEPSIGLHPRDMDRVNSVISRLSRAGNTLVVVEHDPQVMLAADRLIDMGPGAGSAGGEIIFDGTTREALNADTLTGRYLSGRLRVTREHPAALTPKTRWLRLQGVREHNLKNITVEIPLKHMVAITGVSGAGKSTLITDVLVPALERRLQKGTAVPGAFAGLSGTIPTDVVFVDQSPIGRTSRANPVSYVGAFNGVRDLFAASPGALSAGLTAGDFSFNSGNGRCPTCSGTGTEHVEMQFLSDVYLPCPACHGRRYRDTTLEVRITLADGHSYNIADVLELTVEDAIKLFDGHSTITEPLGYLKLVGLGYVRLGQPLTTLSGGENQRLKLAGTLAAGLRMNRSGAGKMLIFDEPTTGLHFDDVNTLVHIFDILVHLGHTVVVVEHNLDMINAADWIIELGPEGGDDGGSLVFTGTPDQLVEQENTHTGRALAAWRRTLAGHDQETFFHFPKTAASRQPRDNAIVVQGAREHNLKNLNIRIPREKFNVITGPSGSGKSTLAFDIIFAEGQRRYLESLNAYARTMVQPPPLPDVDAVRGIPPSVAIEQRTSRGGLRSTVATMTEVYHFIRLLFGKLGTQYCPDCHIACQPQQRDEILAAIQNNARTGDLEIRAPIAQHKKGAFRAELEALRGFHLFLIDGVYYDTWKAPLPKLALRQEHDIEVIVGTWRATESVDTLRQLIDLALSTGRGALTASAVGSGTAGEYYSTLSSCPQCGRSFPALDPKLFSYNSSVGACTRCSGYGILTEALKKTHRSTESFDDEPKSLAEAGSPICSDCHGDRLNPVALNVFWHDKRIADIGHMTIDEAASFFTKLKLDAREAAIAEDAIKEITSRLAFLQEVGLGYLTLDRSAPTLSGGEAQRIRLAAQLGSNLQGVCYVLDEPTIGLHPRDNHMLLNVIESLTRKGNTLLVVEHDEDTIRRAENIIDIGPKAGTFGGQLVAEGTIDAIEANPQSVTGQLLKHPLQHSGEPAQRFNAITDPKLTIEAPSIRNLAIDSLDIPLNRLVVLTGVSGSGKSTLLHEVLYKNLFAATQLKKGQEPVWENCTEIKGWSQIRRVLAVDQTPIGKTPRSCPATYVGFYDDIRMLFAGLPESQARGYDHSRFSFNTKGGRCEACAGQGFITLEMNFMPDVKIECEVCHGARFDQETQAVTWKGRNIGDILKMSVEQATELFAGQTAITRPLSLMSDVGLGYLQLGQPSPTLSGGEAQRLKLVTELAKIKDNGTRSKTSQGVLYVLDEPTVGLHMNDVAKLITVIKRLVAAGNTVVVIEHNLDVIAEADWVIDLGPEAGKFGGRLCGEGTPKDISQLSTHTGVALKEFLATHQPDASSSRQEEVAESAAAPHEHASAERRKARAKADAVSSSAKKERSTDKRRTKN